MGRFVILPAYDINEDGSILSYDMRVNPFQIESYVETDLNYIDELTVSNSRPSIRISMKSGIEHNIVLGIEEFENAIE